MGEETDKTKFFIKVVREADAKVCGCSPLPRAALDSPILISPLWSPVKVCGRPAGSHAGSTARDARTPVPSS